MVSEDDEKNHNKTFKALENVSKFRIFLVNTGNDDAGTRNFDL